MMKAPLPGSDDRPAWMRPRQRLNPTTSSGQTNRSNPPQREKIVIQSGGGNAKRGSRSKNWLSAFSVIIVMICGFMWHWSQNAIMVLLEEKEDLSNNIAVPPKPAALPAPGPAKRRRNRRPKNNKPPEQEIKAFLNNGPIFYNVFVPDSKIGNVRNILKEQLTEWETMDPNSTIIYTLIADKHADEVEEIFKSTCSKCKQRARVTKGDEVDTLEALWQYCNLDTVPSSIANDTLVSYIHNKGSFHSTKINDRARKRGTRCAFSCRQQMPSNPSLCNMCTSVFRVVPQYHGSTKYVADVCRMSSALRLYLTRFNFIFSLQHVDVNMVSRITSSLFPRNRCQRKTNLFVQQLHQGTEISEGISRFDASHVRRHLEPHDKTARTPVSLLATA